MLRKGSKAFPACVQPYGSFCNRWSFTQFGDCLDIHNKFDYEEKGVRLNICKKIQNDPMFTNYPHTSP